MDEIDKTLKELEDFETQLGNPFADPTEKFTPPPQFDFKFTTPPKQQYTPPPPPQQQITPPPPPKQQVAPPPPPKQQIAPPPPPKQQIAPPPPPKQQIAPPSPLPQQQIAPPPQQQAGTKFCKFCGHMIHEEAALCPHCGRQVDYIEGAMPVFAPPPQVGNVGVVVNANAVGNNGSFNVPEGKRKSKWTAVVLCLFLGWLGAHRFYEGKIFTAILYLCTFWTGWTLIAALVDLIMLFQKPNPYYVEKHSFF